MLKVQSLWPMPLIAKRQQQRRYWWRVARGHFDVMMCGMGGSADTLDKARRMMQANGYTKTDKIGHISNFIPIIVYDKDGEVIDLQSI